MWGHGCPDWSSTSEHGCFRDVECTGARGLHTAFDENDVIITYISCWFAKIDRFLIKIDFLKVMTYWKIILFLSTFCMIITTIGTMSANGRGKEERLYSNMHDRDKIARGAVGTFIILQFLLQATNQQYLQTCQSL